VQRGGCWVPVWLGPATFGNQCHVTMPMLALLLRHRPLLLQPSLTAPGLRPLVVWAPESPSIVPYRTSAG
jgi:hypothetical protein